MARIIPIAIVGLALVLYALWRGAYPDLFEETEPAPPAQTAAEPAADAPAATEAPKAPAPATEAAPGKLPVTPQLDVVRIDKDGDTVIAGTAEPGASVTIATQDRTLAVVKADDHGKWVALPEKPLPAGDHAVTIEATGKNGDTEVGDKTIVVSIPEGNTGEKPLVVAVPTKDFGASEVLQRPGPPPGAEEPAGIGREPPPDAPAPPDKPIVVAEAPKAPAQPAGTVAAAPEPQRTQTTDEGATESSGTDKPVAAAEAPATPAAQPAQPDRGAAREGEAGKPPSTVAQAPAGGSGAPSGQQQATAAADGKALPEGESGEAPATAAETAAKPGVDKAAPKGDKPGARSATAAEAPVKPGVDKAASGDGTADRPAAGKPAEGTQPADPAAPAGGGAEKPPAAVAGAPAAPAPSGTGSPAPAATAQRQAAATEDAAPPGGTAPATSAPEEQQAAAPQQPSSGGVSVDSVDYDDRGNLALAGKARPGSVVEPKIASGDSGSESLGETRADEKGEWRLKVERPVAPGRYDLTVEERSPEGTPRSRIRLPFERADPISDFPAGAIVVVQPGNSLWRIARRIYGRGVRYTVIYAANRTQIGNPDLIFPGQIFSVPEKTQVN